jgi:hypothetical protein
MTGFMDRLQVRWVLFSIIQLALPITYASEPPTELDIPMVALILDPDPAEVPPVDLGEGEPELDVEIEIQDDPAPPLQPKPTKDEFRWRAVLCGFSILSDLGTLASGTLLICTQAIHNPKLLTYSASISVLTNAINAFRGFPGAIETMQGARGPTAAACEIVTLVSQAGGMVGLGLLAGGQVGAGLWIAVCSAVVRFTCTSIELGTFGIDRTFGNHHRVTNIIFRIAITGVAQTISGILLGTGFSANYPPLVVAGFYGLGISSDLGAMELLVRDIQNAQNIASELNNTTSAPVIP